MSEADTKQVPFDGGRWGMAISALVALCYAAYLWWVMDGQNIYEFDSDEGYNVIKAMLLGKGYAMFDQIWSDQPPTFTFLLWAVFETFGETVEAGRGLSIAFSSLLVFGIFDAVRRVYGLPSALGSVLFLVFSERFVGSSISIMLGMASIAMVVLSGWALVVWSQGRKRAWLVASGVFFALSISIKLFTLFILPAALLCILLFGHRSVAANYRAVSFDLVLWSAAFLLASLVLLSPAWLSDHPFQLIAAHAHIRYEANHPLGVELWRFIKNDRMIMALSVPGLIYGVVFRNVVSIFFGLWLVLAWVVLRFHYPVWYHHSFLLLVPASVMAGSLTRLVETGLRRSGWKVPGVGAAAVATLLALLFAASIPLTAHKRLWWLTEPMHYSNDIADRHVDAVIERYAGPRRSMITSRQMYAFRTGHTVPPFLSVTSTKRYLAGLWDADTVLRILDSEDIEQVVLSTRWRPEVVEQVEAALPGRYTKVYEDPENRGVELFVRNDLVHRTR